MSQETVAEYIIKSENDNQTFFVNKNIINASDLLKNLCDLTKVTEAIIVKQCSGKSIDIFVQLISHYDVISDKHDKEFEKVLFNNFTDNELAELVKDLSILDSEFFMDSVADYILDKISRKKSLSKIQEYLGLENDFTEEERELIEKNAIEYFLGINFDKFEFPFPQKSLYSIKTKFYSPLNVLMAKIIERSNGKNSYLLSLINKAIKNEVDRHPLKLLSFKFYLRQWILRIFCSTSKIVPWNGEFSIDIDETDIKYFNVIKKRKVIAKKFERLHINKKYRDANILCSSLDFTRPTKCQRLEVLLHFDCIQDFDVQKCPFRSIFYELEYVSNYKKIFDNLVAKDLSKEYELHIRHGLGIFPFYLTTMTLFKKPNHSKFHRIDVRFCKNANSGFKEFVMTYMDADEGVMNFTIPFEGIPKDKSTTITYGRVDYYSYPISDIKEYMESIMSKI